VTLNFFQGIETVRVEFK